MDPDKAHALRVCGPMIIQSLDPDAIIDYLFSKSWISHNEIELIGQEKTAQKKSRKILELIRLRPSGAFDDFLVALDSEGSFLAAEIRKHIAPSPSKKKEHSLSDLRELLIEGAVPDKPTRYINRPHLVSVLSNKLRALADHFRVDKIPVDNLTEVDITPQFRDYSDIKGNLNPPPTNAWLLIHGSPGSGKSVLSASVLRQESTLLVDCFPGGVIWMHVGPLLLNTLNSDTVSYSEQKIIQLVDRLSYRVNQLGDHVPGGNASPNVSESHQFPTNPSLTLDDSLERLRRSLIRKQQRMSWGPDKNGNLITSLLLIILDDVWDVEVGRVLSNLPGAFLVTSRNSDVLERVETPVDKLHLHNDLSEDEIASLLSMWTGYSVEQFIPSSKSSQNLKDSDISLPSISQMTYGLPFAVSLLGNLLYSQAHRLTDYIIDVNRTGSKFLDWVAIKRPSAYGYDSVFQAFDKSISLLSPEHQAYYRRLVIFDPGIVLTPKLCGILWAIPEDKAEMILSIYTRHSLAVRHWIYKVGDCGYTIHGIQLDLLKSYIEPAEQANYHGRFIQNYFTFCGGRWLKLISSWEHIYFWNHATEHLFKAVQLDKLVDLLINLDFLRGRLKIIGTTPVIADFQRYRAVFVTLNRMAEWLAYLRFIQTNAYYIIDPTIVQDCERSRSPCQGSRRSSMANLDLSPPNFRPDSRCISPVESRRNLFSRNIRSNSINIPDRPSYNTTSPKGIDLLQLGLGLSQDNPVFQQAFQLLTQRHEAVLKMHPSSKEEVSKILSIVRAFKYYWFWCNSHIAASQLLWAIPTGFQAVTCLAIELPYTISSIFTNVSTDDSTETVISDNQENLTDGSHYLRHNNRYRKRYLASTSDGRVLLLDANSGYEVALHQVYSPETEVKFLSFLSNNTECLTCGSNGSLVISTLPVAEEIPNEEFYPYDKNVSNHEIDTLPLEYYMNHRGSCDLDAIGDDNDDISSNDGFIDSKLSSQHSTSENFNIYLESYDSELSIAETIRRRRRSTIVSPVYDSSPIDVPAPIVLADLPRLTELARVDNAKTSTSPSDQTSSDSAYQLQCIAANPSVDLLIMIGEGCLDSVSHRVDGVESTTDVKTTPKLPNVYHLKRGSGGQLRLDCSRELNLPYLPSNHWYLQLCTDSNSKVHLASVSEDGNIIAVCLSDGFIWFYNLDTICWISCISTKLSIDFVTKFLSQRFSIDVFTEYEQSQLFDPNSLEVGVGPAASCVIFLPSFTNHSNPNDMNNAPVFFAASLSTQVLIWCLPNSEYQFSESGLLEKETLCRNSFPRLHLSCSFSSTVLSMDARIIEGQCILAGGTASGRVLIWRVRDGCKLVELSVHASWVTAIRLLPDDFKQFSDVDYFDFNINKSSLPIGLLTASVDGVIKRWDVGATCLPTPTTPTPTGPVWPYPSASGFSSHRHSTSSNAQTPIAVHGLWTQVLSVWFGEHGSLLVVGRRRHSSDLQFLFRPKQLSGNNGTTCSFQEITLRPNQSSYWNPQVQHKFIEVNSCESVDHKSHKNSMENNHQPGSSVESSKKSTFKHWILSTGLSSSVYGVATAVTFSNGGNWVAVGFDTGNVIVYSLHFDDSHLCGIVKRYYLLAFDQNSNKTNIKEHKTSSSSCSSSSTLNDHILHLHTWMPEDCVESTDSKNSKLLVVVGVYESGCVKVWYLSDICHKISDPAIPCVNVYPTECFPKLHSDTQSLNGSVNNRKTKLDGQTGYLNDSFPNNTDSVVTWSTCRLIERSQHPLVCDYRTRSPERRSSLDKTESKILVWFTSGHDGRVFGRELIIPSNNRSVTVNEENKSDSKSNRWTLDLNAHTPMKITDADIGPSGHWLVTGSTDKTAKVWFLPSGTLAFDTGTHPMCVRSVAFQPVVDLDGELIMVTGDDEGTLRVWRLTAQMLCSQIANNRNTVLNEKMLYSGRPVIHESYRSGADRDQKSNVRIPSPDPMQHFSSRSGNPRDNRLFHKRPDYYSTAAGYGSAWLHKLTWSPDGRLLAGLSDRLCVWPFESIQQFDSSTDDSNDSSDNINTSIVSIRRISVQDKVPILNPPKFEIQQCRVLRVLSSGVCNLVGTSSPLMVSSSRLVEINSNDDKNNGPFSSIDLPPTIVTVDSNTGTLYIFDPVGSLF